MSQTDTSLEGYELDISFTLRDGSGLEAVTTLTFGDLDGLFANEAAMTEIPAMVRAIVHKIAGDMELFEEGGDDE